MMPDRHHLAFVLIFSLRIRLAAWGAPGPPLPPSLELAKPGTDLHGTRKGDKVYLSWTVPTQTMDYQLIRRLGPTRICRTLEVASNQCMAVGEVQPLAIPKIRHERGQKPQAVGPALQASYTDVLPPDLLQQHPTASANYAVEVLNVHDRSAGLSNQISIPLAPTLPAPTSVEARVTSDGVALTWTGTLAAREFDEINYLYRIYRRVKGEKTDAIAGEIPVGGSPEGSFVDHGFEWQKNYEYRVAPVTVLSVPGQIPIQVEGDDSPPSEVFANDVFPPSVPSGLQAVASGVGQQPFIDLTWAPNTEADLAGYNIYRRDENGQSIKINSEFVKTPAYRDNTVQSGKRYIYSVSAVDLRANESDHSEEASETVP